MKVLMMVGCWVVGLVAKMVEHLALNGKLSLMWLRWLLKKCLQDSSNSWWQA
jgi:hypothetical protein